MNISLSNAKYFITKENIENLTISELGFILTVFRDNCLNEETYQLLDKIVKQL